MRLLAAALAVFPVVSEAQQARNCAPHSAVVERLAERYGEARQVMALGSNNSVIEVFASEAGSWTLTVTAAGGLTCLVAAGQHFEIVAEKLPEGVDG